MSLVLSSRDGARVEIANGVRAAVQGEREWFATGSPEALASLVSSLGRRATWARDDLLLLDFGNVVGLFAVHGGVLEVRSGKWSVADFDHALDDLFRVAADLPFHATETSPLPVGMDPTASNDVLYRAFIYLRDALRADHRRSLASALRAIARDPHRRFERHEVTVPISLLRDVRFDKLPAYLAGTTRWARGVGLVGLGFEEDGVVPAELPEPRVRDTLDTTENRFVRSFVDQALFIVVETQRAARGHAAAARVDADAREMRALLETARRVAPLRDAGRLSQVPLGSTVLQRRRGYCDVLHHFVRMRHAVKGLPFSSEAFEALLESRDVAHIYELWAFFRVIEALRAILGPPTSAEAPSRTDLGVVVKRLKVAWGPDVRATYQETFSAARGTSYSLSYEPDVSLHARGKLHLFDAKFRLERPKDGTEEDSFRQADLDKMHAYRDAIRDARSAWVLYPGTEAVYYDASSGRSLTSLRPESEGVGALPLRPSDGRVLELDRVLRGLLGVSMSEQLGEASAQGAA